MSNKIKLYLGDSKEVLKQIPNNSVDLIVTDPPYQLDSIRERFGKKDSAPAKFGKDGAFQRASKGFMGKKWDVLPPIEVWKECLRVLKPGAFAFVMTTTRQDSLCQILMDLSKAGFCMGFSSIYWSYASGFPKASNISKLIDKQECKKQLIKKLGRKPTKKEFEEAWKDYREIIGRGNRQIAKNPKETTFAGQNKNFSETAEGRENSKWITSAKSPQAKELDGSYSGFQPKPAVEIIIVAMKPLSEKTYVDQALKNGKGITWLDNCRIPHNEEQKETKRQSRNENQTFSDKSCGFKSENLTNASASPKGRFPANLVVSDDVLNDGKISKSTKSKSNYEPSKPANIPAGCAGGTIKSGIHFGDSGSYSRYFDLDKWWIERVKKLPPEVQKVFPYLIVPKASKREKNKGCENLEEKDNLDYKIDPNHPYKSGHRNDNNTDQLYMGITGKPPTKKKNHHPTVKPIKLMSYLITLGSKEGEVVLDPFMGSGTTGISAKLLDRKFIGIEMSEEYIKIAKARIEGWGKDEN